MNKRTWLAMVLFVMLIVSIALPVGATAGTADISGIIGQIEGLSIEEADGISYIAGLQVGSNNSASSVTNDFSAFSDWAIQLKSNQGAELSGNDNVGTGSTITLTKGSDSLSAPFVVKGDVTGSGLIDITDLVTLANAILDPGSLTGLYKIAGDFNDSGVLDITDLVQEATLILQQSGSEPSASMTVDGICEAGFMLEDLDYKIRACNGNLQAAEVATVMVSLTTLYELPSWYPGQGTLLQPDFPLSAQVKDALANVKVTDYTEEWSSTVPVLIPSFSHESIESVVQMFFGPDSIDWDSVLACIESAYGSAFTAKDGYLEYTDSGEGGFRNLDVLYQAPEPFQPNLTKYGVDVTSPIGEGSTFHYYVIFGVTPNPDAPLGFYVAPSSLETLDGGTTHADGTADTWNPLQPFPEI